VGDTFMMAVPENVLIKVAGQSVFKADVGKVGPNAAVSMKNRVRSSEKKDG
jgi:flagellar motor switch protein FliM